MLCETNNPGSERLRGREKNARSSTYTSRHKSTCDPVGQDGGDREADDHAACFPAPSDKLLVDLALLEDHREPVDESVVLRLDQRYAREQAQSELNECNVGERKGMSKRRKARIVWLPRIT